MNIADILKVLAFGLWVIFVGIIFVVTARAAKGQGVKGLMTTMFGVLVVALIVTVVSMGLVFVNPEQRGVVISALQPEGYRSEALQPGLRFVVPFAEQVKTYNISRQTYTMSSGEGEGQVSGDDSIPARTKDGQQVQIDASIIYSIDPTRVIQLHIQWQDRFEDQVVRPVARAAIRDAVSQYGIEEVVSTKRAELETMISEEIRASFAEQNLVMSDFLLRNITFSEEYGKAVEQKQVAEQQAQQAKFVVEQKKQEAEQARQTAQGQADAAVIAAKGAAEARLIQAEAEAKSLELIAAALKDKPELLTYQYITKLTPTIQTMLLPADSPFLFPLPEMQTTLPVEAP